jgi:zinc protease
MQTAPEDAKKAIGATIALLKQVENNGVTQAEVAAAKRSITSEYPVSLADPDGLARTILNNEIYGLGADELRKFVQQIDAVTLEQVNQAAKELLHPENLVVVTAGPPVSASTN